MRKSMKRFVAVALTAVMAMGMTVTSFAEETTTPKKDDLIDVVGADTMFTACTGMTGTEWTNWAPADSRNLLKDTAISDSNGGKIKSFVVTVPSKADVAALEAKSAGSGYSGYRFGVTQFNEDVVGSYPRIFLGRPDLGPAEVDQNGGSSGYNSQIRLTDDCIGDSSYKATVFFDASTYALTIFKGTSADDFTEENKLDYLVEYFGNDDAGVTWATPKEISGLTIQAYADKYVKQDKDQRIKDIAKIGISTSDKIPDLAKLDSDLASLVMTKKSEAAETTEQTGTASTSSSSSASSSSTSTGTSTSSGTTASSGNATTTAANASTKTGDSAPIALFGGLMVAVAVVAVAARKRSEA